MSFKSSHIVSVCTSRQANLNGNEVKQATLLETSLFTKTAVYGTMTIGLLFVLTGGIKALFGLVMLAFGLFFAMNSRTVTLDANTVTLSPAFGWMKLSKPEKAFAKPAQFTLEETKGDFSFAIDDFRFFPLTAQRLSFVDTDGKRITLAYLLQSQADALGLPYETNAPATKPTGTQDSATPAE